MTNEELLRGIAQSARHERLERDALPASEQLEKLSSGELGPDEIAELERLAATSEEARIAHEAFAPLGPQARERITAKALEALSAGNVTALPNLPYPGHTGHSDAPAVRAQGGAQVIPFRARAARTTRRLFVVAGPLAIAAGVALFALRTTSTNDVGIPAYEMSLTGGDRETRGAEAPSAAGAPMPRKLTRESRVEIVLRPLIAAAGQIEARAFLVRGSDVRLVNAPVEVSSDGAVRIAGTVDALFDVPPGVWQIEIAVGRPNALPRDGASLLAAKDHESGTGSNGWQLLRYPVELDGAR